MRDGDGRSYAAHRRIDEVRFGNARGLPEDPFGPGLPSVREWTTRPFAFASDDPAGAAGATRIAELISGLI